MPSSLELGNFAVEHNHPGKCRFLTFSDLFSQASYAELQKGFEHLEWKEERSDFYQQFAAHPTKASPFGGLFDPHFFFPFKERLERQLGTKLRNCFDLIAHKLVSAQAIGPHNDYCDPALGYENVRFIFQFAKGQQLSSGGELSFLGSQDEGDVIQQFPHRANCGICFEVSPDSYHAVSAVEGERYSLVMYLWYKDRKYDGSGVEIG